jgi:LuxR family maltose regulon positive regulatory protein
MTAPSQSQSQQQPNSGEPLLSDREVQVAELIAEAKTDRQIAVELNISSFTVRWYVDNILYKLGLPNRVAICRWWFLNCA